MLYQLQLSLEEIHQYLLIVFLCWARFLARLGKWTASLAHYLVVEGEGCGWSLGWALVVAMMCLVVRVAHRYNSFVGSGVGVGVGAGGCCSSGSHFLAFSLARTA